MLVGVTYSETLNKHLYAEWCTLYETHQTEIIQHLLQSNKGSDKYVINVRDISWCCSVQKKGKAPGADGLAMEAIIYYNEKTAYSLSYVV